MTDPNHRPKYRPRWRIAVIGVPVGIVLMGIGIAVGATPGLVLFFIGGSLAGATPVLALSPAILNQHAKPPDHGHSTFGDVARMIERLPPPEPRRERPDDQAEPH